MHKQSKLTRLWEWFCDSDNAATDAAKTSLSYPEDAQQTGTTLIPVVSKSFQDETIIIDGRNFINCEFRACNIQWNGNDFIFTTCTFHGPQKLVSSVAEVATAMELANVCGLLDANTHSPEH